MDDERACVTDVGEVAAQLDRLDELAGRGTTALDPEREDRAGSFWQIPRGPFVMR